MGSLANLEVERTDNRIKISGSLRSSEMRYLFSAMHQCIEIAEYRDVILDFSDCTAIFATPALGLSSICLTYLKRGIDTYVELPNSEKLSRLMVNTNWAHLMDSRGHPEASYKRGQQIPAIRYNNGMDQHTAVNRIIEVILSTLSNLDRDHLHAIEWSINEISDNVLNHSESDIGGLMQMTQFKKNRNAVEFVVCDAGVGIPRTLRTGHPEIRSDTEALDRAIREGVTRGIEFGQGNGLFGSFRIAQLTDGFFEIHSGFASLFYTPNVGLKIRKETIPFNGTIVAASISFDNKLALEDALNFGDRAYPPTDHVELSFDEDESGNVIFNLYSESDGFGSRAAGRPVKTKLSNLLRMVNGRIVVNFEKVPLVSSSYADEVFGRLFVEIGAVEFSKRFDFINAGDLVKNLVNKSIAQRIKVS